MAELAISLLCQGRLCELGSLQGSIQSLEFSLSQSKFSQEQSTILSENSEGYFEKLRKISFPLSPGVVPSESTPSLLKEVKKLN